MTHKQFQRKNIAKFNYQSGVVIYFSSNDIKFYVGTAYHPNLNTENPIATINYGEKYNVEVERIIVDRNRLNHVNHIEEALYESLNEISRNTSGDANKSG